MTNFVGFTLAMVFMVGSFFPGAPENWQTIGTILTWMYIYRVSDTLSTK
jgi:hypothetical protein